jgi:hypothetical protein
VALVASAVPVTVGNGLSDCSWGVEIVPVIQQSACTAAPWEILDFDALNRSCGAEQYHSERCCHIMIGMLAQMLTYRAEKGEGAIPEVRPLSFVGGARGSPRSVFFEVVEGFAISGTSRKSWWMLRRLILLESQQHSGFDEEHLD